MQLLPLGRPTTSASGRMSLRPDFAVRQYGLPGDLLLIFLSSHAANGSCGEDLSRRSDVLSHCTRSSSTLVQGCGMPR